MTAAEKAHIEELAKSLNIASEGVASLFNDAGELQSIEPFTAALEQRNAKAKAERDAQYSRGKKEALVGVEKQLRDKYDAPDDLQGVELVEHIVQTKVEEVKSADPADIEKLPAYTAKKREWEKLHNAEIQKLQQEKKTMQEGFENEKLLQSVERFASDELISGYDAELPADEAKAAKFKSLFLAEVKGGKFKSDENGQPILVL